MSDSNPSPAEVLLSILSVEVVLQVVLLIISSYLFIRVIVFILLRLSERFEQHRVRIRMIAPIIKISVYFVVLYLIASYVLALSSSQVVAFSAVTGAILGFGLKDLFSDLVGGIVVILENPYHVGDQIKMGDYYGEVVDIGLRATKLKTPDDNTVSAPNSLIFTESVASGNYGSSEMMIVTDMFMDPKSDAYLAMRITEEAAFTSKYIYLDEDHQITILLNEFPSHLRVRVKAYVNDLRYEFKFRSDITRRSWKAFSKYGIKAPEAFFPGYYQKRDDSDRRSSDRSDRNDFTNI
ncbi:mechanosensitive ion channel family protein [Methanolobus halotolerans]|uniref:Mechanosensitive ion channel protein MscS n=1 Tax=Methanolobus halotolerans TaxID=2052935 RepID=A0A4E0QZP9_9EURY|nr:mechanosensitive ion channel domain-containing protein [Methanolobus halotolerans]TGC09379.1 mechanosensitive ion channel protein MscS [Methanolobus halotolerans]